MMIKKKLKVYRNLFIFSLMLVPWLMAAISVFGQCGPDGLGCTSKPGTKNDKVPPKVIPTRKTNSSRKSIKDSSPAIPVLRAVGLRAVSPLGDEIEIIKIGADNRLYPSQSASYPLTFRYKLVSHQSSRIWFVAKYQGKAAGVNEGSGVYSGSGTNDASVFGYGLPGEAVDSIEVSLGEVLNKEGENGRTYLKIIFPLDQPLKKRIFQTEKNANLSEKSRKQP